MKNAKKAAAEFKKAEIITADGISWYQTSPRSTFGMRLAYGQRVFAGPNDTPLYNCNGFDIMYKVICMDVDGIPKDVTSQDCVNECPFGYGIRADGKILYGTRAKEWIEKSINTND